MWQMTRLFKNGTVFFVEKTETEWVSHNNKGIYLQDDSEVKNLQISCISGGKDILEALKGRISSWHKLKRVVAVVLRYKNLNRRKSKWHDQ